MSNPIINGPKTWVGFNLAHNSPILSGVNDEGGVEPPPPALFFITTENGNPILTELGQNIAVEHN